MFIAVNSNGMTLQLKLLFAEQVRSIDDVLSIGQQIQVRIMGHDAKGQLQVSHKALTASPVSPDGDVGRPPSDRPSFTRRSGEGQQRPQRQRPRIPQGA